VILWYTAQWNPEEFGSWKTLRFWERTISSCYPGIEEKYSEGRRFYQQEVKGRSLAVEIAGLLL